MKPLGRNTLIRMLREMGVTDKQRREMREIARDINSVDTIEKIKQRNFEVFGEEITPSLLNYENAYRYMSYTGKSFDEILQEYRNQRDLIEQGETPETIRFIQQTVQELQDYGFMITEERMLEISNNKTELDDLLYYKSRYSYYDMIGDVKGMERTRKEINRIIGSL